MHKRIRILDVPVDMVNYEQALSVFRQMMEGVSCELIVTPNAEIVLHATKDQALKKIMEEARLVIPDGIGLVYASRLLGEPLSERVTGIDFFERIAAELAKTGQSVFFLGSKPGVAEKAAAKMQERYPGLVAAGARDGYFREEDEEELVRYINESGAGFLCVALGSPKQEKFMYKHKDRLQVKAAIGAGGSLDVLAGKLERAPEFYQKHGLEWLYRFKQQPGRYKRMFQLPVFMLKVWLGSLFGLYRKK